MAKGDFVFHYGDMGAKFYIILKGAVTILRPIKHKEHEDQDNDGTNVFNQTEVKKTITLKTSKSKFLNGRESPISK